MTKTKVPQEELPRAEPSEEGLPKTDTKSELPEAECASGSTGSKGEPEEKIDFDTVDLRSLWDQQNTDSEGEYESLSSTECNDPEPIILKQFEAFDLGKTRLTSKYKQKAERKAKAIARKKAASTPPWREQAKGSGSSGSRN